MQAIVPLRLVIGSSLSLELDGSTTGSISLGEVEEVITLL